VIPSVSSSRTSSTVRGGNYRDRPAPSAKRVGCAGFPAGIPVAAPASWWSLVAGAALCCAQAATNLPAYYAHPAVLDAQGVIAPWHQGLNGQLDERVSIAVNVLKRYPWVDKPKAVMAAPDFVYNSHWSIKPDGSILIPPTTDWMCGDLCQRAWSIIKGLTAYYQYSGDPIAFIYIPLTVNYILDYGLTDKEADWPLFPRPSTPFFCCTPAAFRGKPPAWQGPRN